MSTPLETRASCRRLIPADCRPRSPSTGARLLAYPIGDLRSVSTIPYAAPSQGPGHGSWPSWSQAAQPSARRSRPTAALGGRSARATLPGAPEAPSPRPRPAGPARPPHEPPYREGARRLDPHPNWPLAVREKRWFSRTLRRKPMCLVVPRHGCRASRELDHACTAIRHGDPISTRTTEPFGIATGPSGKRRPDAICVYAAVNVLIATASRAASVPRGPRTAP
jgi:hypothetical protein